MERLIRVLLPALLLSGAASAVFAGTTGTAVSPAMSAALRQYNQKHYQQALKMFYDIGHREPRNAASLEPSDEFRRIKTHDR